MLRRGDELAEGLVVTAIAGHLRLDVTVDAGTERYKVEVSPRSTTIPSAAVSGDWQAAWQAASGADKKLGERLCKLVLDRVTSHGVDNAIDQIHVTSEAGKIRRVQGGRVLSLQGHGAESFWALEPYVGCTVGCRFCYAQTRLAPWRRATGASDEKWGSWLDIRDDAADALETDLSELPRLPIKFTPIRADPYQAIEARERLTRRCLQVLCATPPPATIVLTRCTLAERDFDLLAKLPNAALGVSMPTMDDQVRQHFEPIASSTHDRFALLRAASAAGIETFAVVQPMLPGKSERLADLLAAHCDSVSLDVLYGVHGAAQDFADTDFAIAADPAWQRERLHEMIELLRERDVPIWSGELPPSARGRG